jgi:hypothetical protein
MYAHGEQGGGQLHCASVLTVECLYCTTTGHSRDHDGQGEQQCVLGGGGRRAAAVHQLGSVAG